MGSGVSSALARPKTAKAQRIKQGFFKLGWICEDSLSNPVYFMLNFLRNQQGSIRLLDKEFNLLIWSLYRSIHMDKNHLTFYQNTKNTIIKITFVIHLTIVSYQDYLRSSLMHKVQVSLWVQDCWSLWKAIRRAVQKSNSFFKKWNCLCVWFLFSYPFIIIFDFVEKKDFSLCFELFFDFLWISQRSAWKALIK